MNNYTNFKNRIDMKTYKLLFLAIAIFASCTITAQVAVTTDGSSPDGSAMLDVKSTDKGFLPPRLSISEMLSIPSPAEGLVVYNTTSKTLNVFDGTFWRDMTGNVQPAIGDFYQGGIIAYIFHPGDPGYVEGETHGLIAAESDQSTGAEWGCSGTLINGADGLALGTGAQNTTDILAGCTTAGIAAKLCADYSNEGYDDWYLPSKNELNKLYLNKTAIGAFVLDYYWSSSEISNEAAWDQDFYNGDHYGYPKDGTGRVRAVRAF